MTVYIDRPMTSSDLTALLVGAAFGKANHPKEYVEYTERIKGDECPDYYRGFLSGVLVANDAEDFAHNSSLPLAAAIACWAVNAGLIDEPVHWLVQATKTVQTPEPVQTPEDIVDKVLEFFDKAYKEIDAPKLFILGTMLRVDGILKRSAKIIGISPDLFKVLLEAEIVHMAISGELVANLVEQLASVK